MIIIIVVAVGYAVAAYPTTFIHVIYLLFCDVMLKLNETTIGSLMLLWEKYDKTYHSSNFNKIPRNIFEHRKTDFWFV